LQATNNDKSAKDTVNMSDKDTGTGSGTPTTNGPTKKKAASAQEALKRFMKIINSFLARPDSGPFREPVDWRGLELYDYPEIIKKQMDLGTVKRKLERKQYPNAAAAAYDVRLVWKNCMTYNTEGSDFWLLAKGYSKRFEDRYRRIRNDCKFMLMF
jgi:Bromodomain